MFSQVGILLLIVTVTWAQSENENLVNSLTTNSDEGDCIYPPATEKFDGAAYMANKPADGFYLPLSSKFEAIELAELLLARNLTTDDDLTKLCLRLPWDKLNETTAQGTFVGLEGKKVTMYCDKFADNFATQNCTLQSHFDFHPEEVASLIITLTDNETYWVAVTCWESDLKKSWIVLSKNPTLSEETTKTILEHLGGLGFKTENAHKVDFDKCPKTNQV